MNDKPVDWPKVMECLGPRPKLQSGETFTRDHLCEPPSRCQYCGREVMRRMEYEKRLKAVEHFAKTLRVCSTKFARQLRALIDDSYGVAGLHHNGEVAPWAELLRGGEYEDWLDGLDELEDQLAGRKAAGRRVVVRLPSYEQTLEAGFRAFETWRERFEAMQPYYRERVFRRLCGWYLREAMK